VVPVAWFEAKGAESALPRIADLTRTSRDFSLVPTAKLIDRAVEYNRPLELPPAEGVVFRRTLLSRLGSNFRNPVARRLSQGSSTAHFERRHKMPSAINDTHRVRRNFM
jgi:hypothetical protein